MHQVFDESKEDAETSAVECLRANLQYGVHIAALHPLVAVVRSYFLSYSGSKIA